MEKIEIQLLLEGIYRKYGFDFRDYVYSSIRRRIRHRMRAERLITISSLQEKVLHDDRFMERLAADFSINVTEMFRDPSFFFAVRMKVVPVLRELPFIRIWHAGCSTGEEVYSMAILLHEEGLYDKTRIYATDISESVLKKAKEGSFPLERMKIHTKNYHQAGGKNDFSSYYKTTNLNATFKPYLGENNVYAQHNLATDYSFNEFHLILCRNVLIYFNKVLQKRVHRLFFESLGSPGFLGLGHKEEMNVAKYTNSYLNIDSNEKIYQKINILRVNKEKNYDG